MREVLIHVAKHTFNGVCSEDVLWVFRVNTTRLSCLQIADHCKNCVLTTLLLVLVSVYRTVFQ